MHWGCSAVFTTPLSSGDAIRFARRVLKLVPGDRGAASTIRRLSGYEDLAAIPGPAPPDSLSWADTPRAPRPATPVGGPQPAKEGAGRLPATDPAALP